ncbi:MAG: bifunctional metallophosphatase/5'-nucleotidase [Fimbriimonadales bacterium]
MRMLRPVTILLAVALAIAAGIAQPFDLTILHTNDIHSRVEPARLAGKELGGYARQAALIAKLKAENPNSLVLNAGDSFQGTLYFNVYVGLADAACMNLVGYQAMAVGNHEFDRGPQPLATFAKLVQFPLLAANLDVSADPDLKGLVQPSTVIEVGGQRIGVVGVTTPELFSISSPGESIRMRDLVSSVQAEVDKLAAEGIDKIVLLSHVGYSEDVALAGKLKGVDVIVGGHSHTPLGRLEFPGAPQSRGAYPTVARGADGQNVLVVQAWQWGMLVGNLRVQFDESGRVIGWIGQPVPVSADVPEDPVAKSLIAALQRPIGSIQNEKIGVADTPLGPVAGGLGENTMANVITDAMLDATAKQGSVAAFMNAGGVRAALEPGPITYGQAISVQPFNNTLVVMDLTGEEIRKALEHGAGGGGMLFPSRGTSYVIDRNKPDGSRVSEVMIAGKPLDLSATYRVTLNSFTAAGGDGHEVLKSATGYRYDTGLLDIDALVEFIKSHSPLSRSAEGRVVVRQ